MWSGRKPNVEYFIIFGCIAYVHISDRGRAKLDEKSHKCVFIGVSEESKAYWLYDPNTKKVIVIRDVVFLMRMWAGIGVMMKGEVMSLLGQTLMMIEKSVIMMKNQQKVMIQKNLKGIMRY